MRNVPDLLENVCTIVGVCASCDSDSDSKCTLADVARCRVCSANTLGITFNDCPHVGQSGLALLHSLTEVLHVCDAVVSRSICCDF